MATITTPLMADETLVDQVTNEARLRSMAAHPCRGARACGSASSDLPPQTVASLDDGEVLGFESGSMATEYGLIAVVAAFICSLMIKWASGGGVFDILSSIVGRIAGFLF